MPAAASKILKIWFPNFCGVPVEPHIHHTVVEVCNHLALYLCHKEEAEYPNHSETKSYQIYSLPEEYIQENGRTCSTPAPSIMPVLFYSLPDHFKLMESCRKPKRDKLLTHRNKLLAHQKKLLAHQSKLLAKSPLVVQQLPSRMLDRIVLR